MFYLRLPQREHPGHCAEAEKHSRTVIYLSPSSQPTSILKPLSVALARPHFYTNRHFIPPQLSLESPSLYFSPIYSKHPPHDNSFYSPRLHPHHHRPTNISSRTPTTLHHHTSKPATMSLSSDDHVTLLLSCINHSSSGKVSHLTHLVSPKSRNHTINPLSITIARKPS